MADLSDIMQWHVTKELQSEGLTKIPEDYYRNALNTKKSLRDAHEILWKNNALQEEIDKAFNESVTFTENLIVFKKIREKKIKASNIKLPNAIPDDYYTLDDLMIDKREREITQYLSEDMLVFSRNFAMELLIRAYKNPGMNKVQLVNGGGSLFSKYARLTELTDAGFLRIDDDARIHQSKLVYTTDVGSKVAELLIQINDVIENELHAEEKAKIKAVADELISGLDDEEEERRIKAQIDKMKKVFGE